MKPATRILAAILILGLSPYLFSQGNNAYLLLGNGNLWYEGNLPTGSTGALDCVTVPGQCDVVHAIVAFLGLANVFTGNNSFTGFRVDMSAATHVTPQPVGLLSAIPATCTVGERYFATDQTPPGYSCTGTNVWTQD